MKQDWDILSHQFWGLQDGGTSTHITPWWEKNHILKIIENIKARLYHSHKHICLVSHQKLVICPLKLMALHKNIVTSLYFPHCTSLSWCGANLDSLMGTLAKYEIYYLKLLWQSKSYINMANDKNNIFLI